MKLLPLHLFLILIFFSVATAFTNSYIRTSARSFPCKSQTHLKAIDADIIIPLIAAAALGTWWLTGSETRTKQAQYAEWEARQKEYQAERERLAKIEPREVWTIDELKQYNGEDETGPILLAVKGDVFNVWKGRNFYGIGGEYHIMAGRDATRFLAKNRLEEESEDELKIELNVAERANLEVSFVGGGSVAATLSFGTNGNTHQSIVCEVWYWTIKNKYELVGQLEGYDPKSTEML